MCGPIPVPMPIWVNGNWFVANSTGELIPIPVIIKLVMGGSEKARLVPARIDGALAKWRRHNGEPKGLSGKSSFALDRQSKCLADERRVPVGS